MEEEMNLFEMYRYEAEYEMADTWYEVEANFCEELDLEPEIYED